MPGDRSRAGAVEGRRQPAGAVAAGFGILLAASAWAGAAEPAVLVSAPAERLAGAVAEAGRLERLPDVDGRRHVIRVTTLRKPAYPWNISLPTPTAGGIAAGDTLQLVFHARKVASSHETGEAGIDCVVEASDSEHRKLAESSQSFTDEWSEISIPFRADASLPAGGAQVALRFGFAPQTVDVANLRLLNHGPDVDPATLPRTVRRYPGFEPDAAWRRAAAERIERLRRSELEVAVVDAAGGPVPGARVRVVLERHAFALGTCVRVGPILGESPDDARYRETLVRHFNKAVFENDLKWEPWERGGEPQRERVLQTIRWLEGQGLSVRGHVLVWPSWRSSPPWLREHRGDPEALRRAIAERVRGQTRALAGLLDEWDVVNENYAHTDFTDILGRAEMAEWFRIAARETPGTRLFYNDYVMFQGDGPGSPSEALHAILSGLEAAGAPVGGIGEQAHFGGNPPGPEMLLAKLDRFAEFGWPIQITEFDVDTADAELQVAFTRDFLTAVFSHPAVNGVICWGFWEGNHWKPRAAFWDKAWNLRPHGRVWLDLFEREWTTDETLVADAGGRIRLRPYKGRLLVIAEHEGRSVTERLDLGGPAELRLALPEPSAVPRADARPDPAGRR